MNHSINKALGILILCLAIGQTQKVQAQSFEIGGGGFLATDGILDFGLDLRGAYRFNEHWRATLALGIFVPEKEELNLGGIISTTTISTKYSAFSINGEANYLFPLKGGKITPYALAGINFVTVSAKVEGTSNGLGTSAEASGDESGISFNFGGGVDFKLNKVNPFVELKYSAGEANYAVIIGGVKFLIN